MAENKKTRRLMREYADIEGVRPPSWYDKHGRPELRMHPSITRGEADYRVTPPEDGHPGETGRSSDG